jgi:hypothetical protein
MKSNLAFGALIAATVFSFASAAFANTEPAPAPMLGAGLPGLAILAAAGGGYIAMRLRRHGKD